MKNVYSIVLSSDVVNEIDKLAYENGTNRSSMIDRILADYVSFTTPEMRFRRIFRQMQEIFEGSALKSAEPSDTMLSLRSALAYKYNPTVKYSVELYRGDSRALGELRVSLRTQNAGLILYMMQFYRLWSNMEERYRGNVSYSFQDGKYVRRLAISAHSDGASQKIDIGQCIAAYIHTFDAALKAYFYHLDAPSVGAAEAERIYRSYLRSSDVVL